MNTKTLIVAILFITLKSFGGMDYGDALARAYGEAIVNGGIVYRVAATGSMKPSLDEKSVCVVRKCAFSDVRIGDIVVYRVKDRDIIHRVAARLAFSKKGFICKGDANADYDRTTLTEKNFIGVVHVIFKAD